ncbi:MAG: DNA mismatch repair endonuclease MutL [Deltaproteobacteria bacterium]|nr:DNA mismatch repair endonuclease MutL [Deltaproteobacteria bacterium]
MKPDQSARIRRLAPEVCNQIAAGEVVERPASVVKELVENALDAGADQIRVLIEEGGKNLIEVIDNGYGMDADQSRLALERHATSKIISAADLFGVASYGFRGEALPSIASVSDFTLISRTAAMEAAVKLEVGSGGEVRESRVGAPVGTRITVRDLFVSVPVRKKFLKTTNTERGAVLERLQRFAMAHSDCSFLLEHDGRKLLNLTKGDREVDRVAGILGLEPGVELRELESVGGEWARLRGYVSLPQVQRPNSRDLYFFVNQRAVRDKALLQALLKAYEGTLPRGRYPAAVLFLEVAAGGVDVNVHPAKEEVRFTDGGRIFALIRRSVAEILSGYPEGMIPGLGRGEQNQEFMDRKEIFSKNASPEILRYGLPPEFGEKNGQEESHSCRSLPRSSACDGRRAAVQVGENRFESGDLRFGEPAGYDAGVGREAFIPSPFRPDFINPPPAQSFPGFKREDRGFFAAMTVVGSLWDSYIVLQSENKCYVLDQHAAHERVLFAELKERRAGDGTAQTLLLPIPVECTHEEEALAETSRELLLELGFEFVCLGPRTLALHTVPLLLEGLDQASVFRQTLADIESGGRGRETSLLNDLLAHLACRLAVKANRPLQATEIQTLLTKLDASPPAHTCPHGRPLYFVLDRGEIEKRFQR